MVQRRIDIKQKIVIVTHELIYGVPQALRDYLLIKKAKYLLFVGLPFIDSRKGSSTLFENGTKTNEKIFFRIKNLGILDYFLDFFQVIRWVWERKEKFDVFIGVDNLNCLAGLFLRRIGRVRRVIFYTMDFVPLRFENKLLNFIYHQIEIFCVKHSDEVWNVSPRMADGREEYFGVSKENYPQKHVPVGIWNDKIKKRNSEQIKKNQILFIGHLSSEKQGIEEVLEAIPQIAKDIKNIKFLIIGGGWYEEFLRNKAKSLNLGNHVVFAGWIKDRRKLDDLMSESAVAVATYKPEEKILRNFSYFADPFKIKDYLGAGLPIVLTNISYNAKEIEKRKCGIIVEYNKKEIANAIIKLLKNEELLKEYRKNALKYAKELDWMNVYDRIFN